MVDGSRQRKASLARQRVLLGVSGGIAAYKAVEVMRGFQQAGRDVHVCLTDNATQFIAPLTFAAISGHPVSVGGLPADQSTTKDSESASPMAHVEVTRGAALFVVAPATANTLAKFATGLADDWLSTHFLANEAPVLLAPAMNTRMWRHPSVQANIKLLRARGATIVAPEDGELACGEEGPGRLADPQRIVEAGLALLARRRDLVGKTVLITSGPTFEDLDPVRFVGNRSSGKMGHALAREAEQRGADVILVSGPTALEAPGSCRVVSVRSAEEMQHAVEAALPGVDLAFFAAAVADFRPKDPQANKIRRDGKDSLHLELERCPDVLGAAVASTPDAMLVGFAAETVGDMDTLIDAGRAKLERKGCDALVANRVGGEASAFEADDNQVVLLTPDGGELIVPRASKEAIARRLLDEVSARLKTGNWRSARRASEGQVG